MESHDSSVVWTITTPDGATSTATLHRAVSATSAVMILPAMGVKAQYYEVLANTLAAAGITALRWELRGHGTSSVRPRRGLDFGYSQLVSDLRLGIIAARERVGSIPLYLLGHSLGGHLANLALGQSSGLADGVVLVASGTPFHGVFQPREALGIRVVSRLIPISRWLGYFPGRRLGFGGNEAPRLMHEWSVLARTGDFVVDGVPMQQTLANVRVPVLALSIEGDRFAPPRAVDHLTAKLPNARIERLHLGADVLPPRARDHFQWAREPAAVVQQVQRWQHARNPAVHQ